MTGFADALARVQACVDDHLATVTEPSVLDCGCGGRAWLQIPESASLVGLDISAEELARNTAVRTKIVGDVQSYPLPAQSYDVVVCWDLLEHLPRPGMALANMRRALRAGGLLVLASPNVMSLKGLVTKLTPFWVHRVYYRWHSPSAHAAGLHPFPTHLRLDMSPGRVSRWAAHNGLTVVQETFYEGPMQVTFRNRVRLTGWRWSALRRLLRVASFGCLDLALTDYILVYRAA